MNFQKLLSFVLASSALLGLAGATGAQELAAAGTTVKVPADQIKFVTSGIRQHGGEYFWVGRVLLVPEGRRAPLQANCLSKEECVIFLVSDGKFDAQTLEKE